MEPNPSELENSETGKQITLTLYRILLCLIGEISGMPELLSSAWAEALRLALDDLEAYNDTFDYDPDLKH